MLLRGMLNRDMEGIKAIHNKFYKDEFKLDELFNKMLTSFVVTSENKEIIVAGGVRTIAEVVIVTNKDIEVTERRLALLDALAVSYHIGKGAGYNSLHAFIQDENWLRHLEKIGFKKTVGQAVVLPI